jgi:hypothetical protein
MPPVDELLTGTRLKPPPAAPPRWEGKAMNNLAATLAAALLSTIVMPFGAALAQTTGGTQNPCAPPTEIGRNIDETAWQLWVAATCPVNNNQYPFVVWEDWIEQAQMYPADPSKGLFVPNAQAATASHQLHGSPFTLFRNPKLAAVVEEGLLGAPDQNCNKAGKPPPNQPKLIICEEVRLNGAAEDYLAGNNLWNRNGQATAAGLHADVQFPAPAIEVKADWIELASIKETCTSLPANSIHIEKIDGNCFALAGIHLISKLLHQWIWATFEPQNTTTNPFRCKVLGCIDRFGSIPAMTVGATTKLSPRLASLMAAANLAPEWSNYRLDGVQSGFYQPGLLGNSIIEGENVGMPLSQSSCISCHAVSSVKSDGTDGIKLLTSNPVGAPKPLPSPAWIRRDFVWSMFLACPHSVAQKCAPTK